MVFNVAVWTSRPLETDVAGSTISALAPLPIGFAVLAAHLVCGPYTGCGINPARVLGAIVFDDNITWESYTAKYAWIYFVGPYQPSIAPPTHCYTPPHTHMHRHAATLCQPDSTTILRTRKTDGR